MEPKAIALFSGGLDSILSVKLLIDQGIKVKALNFITPFFGYEKKGKEKEIENQTYNKYNIDLEIIDITEGYLEVIKNPKYGYGRNINPCLDCKIFMLKQAKEYMIQMGYSFIITGEVVGQRPMSQRKDAMRIVERDAGLDGYLLRPLSAKLLKVTIPEEMGLVNRNDLLDMSGRSRKKQIELAKKYNIDDYPPPAGGCLLTDPILSLRIKDLLKENTNITESDIRLVQAGRYFKLSKKTNLIVGRNSEENQKISSLLQSGDIILKTDKVAGPLSVLRGEPSDKLINKAASITARYSDALKSNQIRVNYGTNLDNLNSHVIVSPIQPEDLEKLRAS